MTRLDAARGQAQARRLEEQAQVEVVRRINVLVKRDPARFVDLWYTHHSANEVAGGRRITMRDGSTVPAGVLRNASMGTRAGHPDLVNYAPRTFRGRHWAGLALELKIEPNTLTVDQENYLMHLHRCGWLVEALSADDPAVPADQAWLLLVDYLGIAPEDYAPLMLRRGRRR